MRRWVKAFAVMAAFWATGFAAPPPTTAPEQDVKYDKGLVESLVQQTAPPSSGKTPSGSTTQAAKAPSRAAKSPAAQSPAASPVAQTNVTAQPAAPKANEIVIDAVTPAEVEGGNVVTITFSPPFDPSSGDVRVLFGGRQAEVTGRAPGALDVLVPARTDLTERRMIPVVVRGDIYTRQPFAKFTYVPEKRPGVLETWSRAITSNLANSLGVALAALGALGVAGWNVWKQREREQGLRAELYRMEARLVRAEAPVPGSPPDDSWSSALPVLPAEGPPAEAVAAPEPEPDLPPSPAPEPPAELVQAIAGGGAILYLGSGVSAQAGLPTWSQFVDSFLGQLEQDEPQADWGAVRAQFNRRAVRVVADLIESRGKGQLLARAVRQAYGAPVQAPPWLSRFIARTPFAGVLTTNFDDVVDRATEAKKPRVLGPTSSVDFGALLRENDFFLMKLHGDPSETPGAAFAVEYLWRALEERPDLRGFLGTLFASRTMFFAGVDTGSIEGFLSAVGVRAGSIRHFALVPEEPDSAVLAESFRGRFNLELIPFRPSPGYPQMEEFFEDIVQQVAAAQAAQPAVDGDSKAKTTPMQISRVRLVNIGPFEDASFDFSPRWTVLLGDNGCGKSTVLRAVALALCGSDDEAARLANSLLRQAEGVQGGMIELTMASNPPTTYAVDLRRTREGVVVGASAYGPLQSGTMVAFGFPALRGVVPGQPPAAATDGANYPRVADVTPLIRGGVDPRVSHLRAWIRDNYARSQDSKLPEAQRQRYDAMLAKLFRLIDDMIPGFEIKLSRYDTVGNEVLLKTPDGELPMDYVSQGMSSTIGWLGVLVQRLYEIYPRTNHPEREHALLLIDEMDSHLHPEWQRVLAPNIKKHFPNVQVIATTHSPLVVANMEAGEVIRVVRWGDEIEVQHVEHSFSGYRADQVLTAEAFGLASTRSVAWEDLRAEYSTLLGKSKKTRAEEARMNELAAQIEGQSAKGQTREQKAAATAVRETLTKQAESLDWDDESKRKTLEAAAERLAKLTSVLPGSSEAKAETAAAADKPAEGSSVS